MSSRPDLRVRRRLALAPALALFALLVVGCGSGSVGYSEGKGDRANGKVLFVKNCGSCHTLADAGTSGQIGPNLDYAFLQSRRDGLGESTFVQVVRGQIAYPVVKPSTGAPGMPATSSRARRRTTSRATSAASRASAIRTGRRRSRAQQSLRRRLPRAAAARVTQRPARPSSPRPAARAATRSQDAGASGTVGPNLDDAKPDAALVKERVTHGKAVMPSFKGQLSDAQIADVAAYVSGVAGK